MSAIVPPVPQPKASPAVWEYKELRPLLTNAGRLVHAEESERRVLMLVKPYLKAPKQTNQLYPQLNISILGKSHQLIDIQLSL